MMNNNMKKTINDVLVEYAVAPKRVDFIRHNENYTCKIYAQNNKEYVLRLHFPNKMQSIGQHKTEFIQSEIKILQAIRNNTNIKTQQPICNLKDQYVTKVQIDNVEYNATLLSWIKGKILVKDDDDFSENIARTGEMMSVFHDFSEQWEEGIILQRPKVDADYMNSIRYNLKSGIDLGLFTDDIYNTISVFIDNFVKTDKKMRSIYTNKWFGLTHCDLGLSNLIAYNNKITPIDFSLSSIGPLFADFMILASLPSIKHREILLNAYSKKRNIDDSHIRYFEMYFIQSILGFMNFHINNEKHHEWFHRRLQPIVNDYILPFLNNDTFVLKTY